MHPVRRIRWLLSVLFILSLAPVAAAQELGKVPALTAEGQQQIDQLLTRAVADKKIPGAVALVALNGKTVYHKGIGMADLETNRQMATDTLFRIASMTKPIASVAAMILVDDGKLKPEDAISKYLPEFKEMKVFVPGKGKGEFTTVPAKREITVHHLLTHTSGITYTFFSPLELGELQTKAGVSDGVSQTEMTTAENSRRIATIPLAHQPGEGWTYGLNTDVLGRVVEAASGKPLDVFLRERIFEPLKMKDTHFYVPPEKLTRLATLYNPGKDKQALVRVGDGPMKEGRLAYSASYPYKGPQTYFSGGAGLVSTASDYARFLQMIMNGGELDGARILKPDTVKTILSNQIGEKSLGQGMPSVKFGYGFGIVTDKSNGKEPSAVGAFSWGGLFSTYFWGDPQNKVVALLMTQVYPNEHLTIQQDFKKRVYEALAK
jgi:CubicO group peptidase (beta-lactamase class C family)